MAISFRYPRTLLLAGGLAVCVCSAFAAVTQRAVVARIPPTYPELARRMHVSGKVVLLVTIQQDGKVSGTKVESGHALLAPAAQEAVSRWRFVPGPDVSESEIDINFTPDGR